MQRKSGQIILCDMDGVLADLEKRFLEIWRERYSTKQFIPLEKRRGFYIEEQYPKEESDRILEILREKNLYVSLEPVEGSLNALKEMERNNLVYICTSPFTANPFCLQEKYEWIRKNLGKEWLKRLVMTSDKTLVRGDKLIDDKPEVTGLLTPSWEHIIFDQPYNRHIQNKKRINWNNWEEIYQ